MNVIRNTAANVASKDFTRPQYTGIGVSLLPRNYAARTDQDEDSVSPTAAAACYNPGDQHNSAPHDADDAGKPRHQRRRMLVPVQYQRYKEDSDADQKEWHEFVNGLG